MGADRASSGARWCPDVLPTPRFVDRFVVLKGQRLAKDLHNGRLAEPQLK